MIAPFILCHAKISYQIKSEQRGIFAMGIRIKTYAVMVQIMGVIIMFFGLILLSGDAFAKEAQKAGKDDEKAVRSVPKDVDPESGFRLPLPKRDDFDEEGKKIFDKRVGKGARSVRGLQGPSGIRLYSPKLADYSNSVSQYLRFETGFSGRIRELAILVTAREMNSQFEWAAHEPEALKEGLPKEIIEIVKYRKGVEEISDMEAVIINLGRQMFGKKSVDPGTFARALKIFGPRQLVDLVSLMTNYQGTATLLTVFDMQLDPDQKPLLPMP
jgi:4-carboxymuconolactone decarboxylase